MYFHILESYCHNVTIKHMPLRAQELDTRIRFSYVGREFLLDG
jgi:hypothetical protein